MTFFTDCLGLFNKTFQAVCTIEYFRLLIGFLLAMIFVGLFRMLSRGTRKL